MRPKKNDAPQEDASAVSVKIADLPVITSKRWYVTLSAAVGILGFYYHTTANLRGPSPSTFDNFVFGAPALAPLLFPNLVLLAAIGLWGFATENAGENLSSVAKIDVAAHHRA